MLIYSSVYKKSRRMNYCNICHVMPALVLAVCRAQIDIENACLDGLLFSFFLCSDGKKKCLVQAKSQYTTGKADRESRYEDDDELVRKFEHD